MHSCQPTAFQTIGNFTSESLDNRPVATRTANRCLAKAKAGQGAFFRLQPPALSRWCWLVLGPGGPRCYQLERVEFAGDVVFTEYEMIAGKPTEER